MDRFSQRDPIGLQGGINQYAYVGNNPVNFTDLDAWHNQSYGETASQILEGMGPMGPGPELGVLSAAALSIKEVRLGQVGEQAVSEVYDIGQKAIFNINGNSRIADGFNRALNTISEVKNVATQAYTSQLRDYVAYSQLQGLKFDLYVRESTVLSGPLKDVISSGLIRFNLIPKP